MPGYFINDVNDCVDESLIGYVRAHHHLELLGRAVIARAQVPSVAVISGNGSGHEPAMVSNLKRVQIDHVVHSHLCSRWVSSVVAF
jgi:dihydroxyacetone kinase